jgi:hypothetical protein
MAALMANPPSASEHVVGPSAASLSLDDAIAIGHRTDHVFDADGRRVEPF